jgi:hypothetical protein
MVMTHDFDYFTDAQRCFMLARDLQRDTPARAAEFHLLALGLIDLAIEAAYIILREGIPPKSNPQPEPR